MAGRICRVFPGHTFDDCYNWTRDQLKLFYWESFRQEARQKLFWISVMRIARGGEESKQAITNIEIQAYPPDPEADGDMDKKRLRVAFESFKKAKVL